MAVAKGGKANVMNLVVTGLACGALWYFGTQMVRAGDTKNAAVLSAHKMEAMQIVQAGDQKNADAILAYKIAATKQQTQTLLTLQQINGALSGLTDQMKDVKKTVETTDKRLWEVRKDVYTIKTRRNDS
jgi:hypothetical protein